MSIRRVVLVVSMIIAFMTACSSPFDEKKNKYEPWYYNPHTDEVYVLKDLITKEHYDKVERVLEYYCNKYQRNGPVDIEFVRPIDVDLIMNYRKKAEDSEWWLQHIEHSSSTCPDEN